MCPRGLCLHARAFWLWSLPPSGDICPEPCCLVAVNRQPGQWHETKIKCGSTCTHISAFGPWMSSPPCTAYTWRVSASILQLPALSVHLSSFIHHEPVITQVRQDTLKFDLMRQSPAPKCPFLYPKAVTPCDIGPLLRGNAAAAVYREHMWDKTSAAELTAVIVDKHASFSSISVFCFKNKNTRLLHVFLLVWHYKGQKYLKLSKKLSLE